MCVLITKPSGVKKPSLKTLKKCYLHNPHGCGFCTPTKNFKSLSFDEFIQEFDKVETDEPCIIHFRLATHGSRTRKNCHPFYNEKEKIWFAHNGILDIRTVGDLTDSETFFKYVYIPIVHKYGYDSKEADSIVENYIGWSKFAFLKDGKIKRYGHFSELDGCQYSNLYWSNVW